MEFDEVYYENLKDSIFIALKQKNYKVMMIRRSIPPKNAYRIVEDLNQIVGRIYCKPIIFFTSMLVKNEVVMIGITKVNSFAMNKTIEEIREKTNYVRCAQRKGEYLIFVSNLENYNKLQDEIERVYELNESVDYGNREYLENFEFSEEININEDTKIELSEFKEIVEYNPAMIKEKLDEYVVGQDEAKKVLAVAAVNHMRRIKLDKSKHVDKSNILLIGPTGCGKTYLVTKLAEILNVPLAICDATQITAPGYKGDEPNSVLTRLLQVAEFDVKKAEHGIVFIDEIDKQSFKKSIDASSQTVQQALLKIIEGGKYSVPKTNAKNSNDNYYDMDTSNILFIFAGAFSDMSRYKQQPASTIGFRTDLPSKEKTPGNVKANDIINYGFLAEFVGRIPVIVELKELTEDDFYRILTQTKNSVIKQYEELLGANDITLKFRPAALKAMASYAIENHLGARNIRGIVEKLLLDDLFEEKKEIVVTEKNVKDLICEFC